MSNSLRVATWNVNSIRSRKEHLLGWLELRKYPEIVCLQETKVVDTDFPHSEFEKLGYHVAFHGQKAYNGVAIFSKYPMSNIQSGFNNQALNNEARVISAEIEGIKVINVYVPNGQAPQTEKYVWKFEFLKTLEKYLEKVKKEDKKVVVCGDFNIAPQGIDVWDADRFAGQIMFSEPECNWLNKLINSGWHDVFRELNPKATEYSWYDYITKARIGNRGWRIDFILATAPLFTEVSGCKIDCEPRDWEKPSDHCPVVAKIDII